MNKIMGRINGMKKKAERRAKNGTEIDKIVCRQVLRNLSLAKKIIGEEIVTCEHCLSFVDMDELIRQGAITSTEAEAEETLGNAGMCLLDRYVKYVRLNDYCSFGTRDKGKEKEE